MAENNLKKSGLPESYKLKSKRFGCPIDLTLHAIGGKWKLLIVHRLSQGDSMRYNELKANIQNISEKMLIQQLRELEKDGVVKRKVYKVVPPRVEYSLSESGKGLVEVINAMRQWGTSFKE